MTRPGDRAKHRDDVAAALALHARGASPATVAAELDVTVSKAHKLIAEGLDAIPDTSTEEILMTAQIRMDLAADLAGRLMSHEDPRVALSAARELVSIEAARTRVTGSWLKPDSPLDPYDLPAR